MNYLVLECEGSKTAEYQFWEKTLGFDGVIICSKGNKNTNNTLTNLGGVLKSGDCIYLFYDTINGLGSLHARTVATNYGVCITRLLKYKALGISCFVAKDLCFESLVYRLSNIIGFHSDLQKYLQHSISTISAKLNVQLFLSQRCVNCTYEQYVASELHKVTYGTPLLCDKGKLGYCWCSTCGVADNKAFCYMNKDNLLQCWNTNKVATTTLCGRILSADTKLYFQLMHKKGYKREVIYKELGVTSWEGLFRQI